MDRHGFAEGCYFAHLPFALLYLVVADRRQAVDCRFTAPSQPRGECEPR